MNSSNASSYILLNSCALSNLNDGTFTFKTAPPLLNFIYLVFLSMVSYIYVSYIKIRWTALIILSQIQLYLCNMLSYQKSYNIICFYIFLNMLIHVGILKSDKWNIWRTRISLFYCKIFLRLMSFRTCFQSKYTSCSCTWLLLINLQLLQPFSYVQFFYLWWLTFLFGRFIFFVEPYKVIKPFFFFLLFLANQSEPFIFELIYIWFESDNRWITGHNNSNMFFTNLLS